MSSISSGFNSAVNGADNIQDFAGFQYQVDAGADPTLDVIPPEAITWNTFQYDNCSPCFIKVTVQRQAAGPGGKPDPAAEPILDCKVLKPGQSYSWSFDKAVILGATLTEVLGLPAATNAVVFDDDAINAPLAEASATLEGSGAFLNC